MSQFQRDLPTPRIPATRAGSLAITYAEGRRFAILECDADGDIVVTLTDRASDAEADAWVIAPGAVKKNLDRVVKFLGARKA